MEKEYFFDLTLPVPFHTHRPHTVQFQQQRELVWNKHYKKKSFMHRLVWDFRLIFLLTDHGHS